MAATNVIQIDTSDLNVGARPTAKVKIGKNTYTVTAPKIDVWRSTMELLTKVDLAKELAEEDNLDAADQAQRDALVVELQDFAKLESAVIVGVPEFDEATMQQIGIRGGFLRQSLGEASWAKVRAEWKDGESDLDSNVLFLIARRIQEQFQSWYDERTNMIGLPETPKAKRASTGKPAARRRPGAK